VSRSLVLDPAVPPQNGHVMINDLALTIGGNLTVDRN